VLYSAHSPPPLHLSLSPPPIPLYLSAYDPAFYVHIAIQSAINSSTNETDGSPQQVMHCLYNRTSSLAVSAMTQLRQRQLARRLAQRETWQQCRLNYSYQNCTWRYMRGRYGCDRDTSRTDRNWTCHENYRIALYQRYLYTQQPNTESLHGLTILLTPTQGRCQVENSGWTEGASRTYGERGAWAYNGGLGAEPQQGPGAEPLVRSSGGKAPWSWKLLPLDHPNERQHLPL